ncbi:MAG: cupin domain-containing protein [Terriglobales bacterium]
MNQTLIVLMMIVVLPMFALTRSATAQDVEITAEPSHHVALENAHVRAFKVEVAPHAATLMHWHRHDYIFVTLGDAHISNEVEGKSPVEAKLYDGDTRFAPGNFAHIARNLADTPFRNVTIELLQDEKMRPAPAHWDKDSGEDSFNGGQRKILFVKDGVRVSQIELSAKMAMPKDEHVRPRLLVAVSAFELGQNSDGRESPGKDLKVGDMWWWDGPMAVTNAGSGPAKFVILEF